jgi:signal transduction histidine kinase/CheY-like chemotaxis protein
MDKFWKDTMKTVALPDLPSGDPEARVTGEHRTVPAGSAQVVVLVGTQVGRTFVIGEESVVGRQPDCQVQITSEDCSRRHARIRRAGDGLFMLEDLGSRNGTLVNGLPVRQQILRFGDKIQIGGKTLLMFSRYDLLEEELLRLQKMESMAHLAGGVIHDFNNLLGAILANVCFARTLPPSSTTNEELQACLSDIEQATRRAVDLTKQLLGFARRGAKETRLVDLSCLVDEVSKLVSRTFDAAITVETRVEPDLVVSGDPSELHQVLMNLCVNARDAISGRGRISLFAQRVTLSDSDLSGLPYLLPGHYVLAAVKDTGVGMTTETQGHIFEPFFTTKSSGKGLGLGLASAYGIVRKHGGHILVESTLGHGSTFKVFLPTAEAAEEGTPPDLARSMTSGASSHLLLVVDDEEISRAAARSLLEGLGFLVLEARDEVEAIQLFRQHSETVDLVVLDVAMPKIGAAETLRQLRMIVPTVKVLISAAHSDLGRVRALLAQGANGFVIKPYDVDAITQALSDVLPLV